MTTPITPIDPVVVIVDALKNAQEDWRDVIVEVLSHGKIGDVKTTRGALRRAIDFYSMLIDPVRGEAMRAALPVKTSDLATIAWRKIGSKLAPTVRLRLDEYVERLDVTPPEDAHENGRRYSEHRLRVERRADCVIVWTHKLATDATEDDDAEA